MARRFELVVALAYIVGIALGRFWLDEPFWRYITWQKIDDDDYLVNTSHYISQPTKVIVF